MTTEYFVHSNTIHLRTKNHKTGHKLIDTFLSYDTIASMSQDYSIVRAANMLGISVTTLKRCCRLLGMTQWQYRTVQSKRRQEFKELYRSLNLDREHDVLDLIES